MGLSIGHLLIFLIIVLLFMGPGRVEKLGPSLGKALRGFKKGLSGEDDEEEDHDAKTVAEQTARLEAKLESLQKRAKKTKAAVSDDD
jgi:sec-independent protein translocase protein TatA